MKAALKCLGKTLTSEKAPYVLTVILAAIAWSTTRIVDRVTQIPMIEYRFTAHCDGKNKIKVCEVTNLCQKVFRDLHLYLTSDTSETHIDDDPIPEIVFVKPVMPDLLKNKVARVENGIAAYDLPELQPFCTAQLRAAVGGKGEISLRFHSPSAEPVRLMAFGLPTFVVRHEIGIYIGLLVVWLVCLLLYALLVT